MKSIALFLKYYLYGFIIAALIGALLIIYSIIFDDLYSFIDFNLYMQVNSIMAVPCGLHLWIIYLINRPEIIKNKHQKFIFKFLACFWISCIANFLILFLIIMFNNFLNVTFLSFINEDNLLQITFIISLPTAWYLTTSKIFKKI